MQTRLFTLETFQTIGHLRQTKPIIPSCKSCGRNITFYDELELVIDTLPTCDIMKSVEGAIFTTERFITELEGINAKGYSYQSIDFSLEDKMETSELSTVNILQEIPLLNYFVITGRCDGPWLRNKKGELCHECGKNIPEPIDFESIISEILGDKPTTPILVYPETWNGEDFFYITEPGPPIITERVVDILNTFNNLQKEIIVDKDRIRRLMPTYAAELNKKGWQVDKCVTLGPADWINN